MRKINKIKTKPTSKEQRNNMQSYGLRFRVWNSLPRHVTSAPSPSVYCSCKQSFPWLLLL